MTANVPTRPKIYHITHVDNLARIVRGQKLWSDANRIERGLESTLVGMSSIKKRRLHELEVPCNPGTKVGECVPFYFCPRSIMLYILRMGNHPDVTYRGGQGPILHLVADLNRVVEWATRSDVKWAFSTRNAGARLTEFYNSLQDLDKVDWNAVEATDFRDPVVREGKQAEFLVRSSFPWTLIERVGVLTEEMRVRVDEHMREASHRPPVSIEPLWYY